MLKVDSLYHDWLRPLKKVNYLCYIEGKGWGYERYLGYFIIQRGNCYSNLEYL